VAQPAVQFAVLWLLAGFAGKAVVIASVLWPLQVTGPREQLLSQ